MSLSEDEGTSLGAGQPRGTAARQQRVLAGAQRRALPPGDSRARLRPSQRAISTLLADDHGIVLAYTYYIWVHHRSLMCCKINTTVYSFHTD